MVQTASWCPGLVVLELSLYEFTHLDVCTVTDGKTAVDVILHVVRLARQSPRNEKVVPVRKWR